MSNLKKQDVQQMYDVPIYKNYRFIPYKNPS
jgi:hypothetical protein